MGDDLFFFFLLAAHNFGDDDREALIVFLASGTKKPSDVPVERIRLVLQMDEIGPQLRALPSVIFVSFCKFR